MSVETRCPDGITSETLSAWRDGALSEAEAARIAAHVTTCSTCQARIQAYRGVGELIGAQRIPATQAVDVTAIRAGQPSATAPRARNTSHRAMPRAVWGGIGAAVAAAVLIAAFAQVFTHLERSATTTVATATATPVPITTLVWSKRTLPPRLTFDPNQHLGNVANFSQNFVIAPSSSQYGWICVVSPDGNTTIWATTDEARTWHVATTIPQPAGSSRIGSCYLIAGQNSATDVSINLTVISPGSNALTNGPGYISTDGGRSWIPQGSVVIPTMVRMGKQVYEVVFSPSQSHEELRVSGDGFKTWRVLAPPWGTTLGLPLFSIDSQSGALLLAGEYNAWRSDDGGQTWQKYTLTYNVSTVYTLTTVSYLEPTWLSGAHVWRLCGTSGLNHDAPIIHCTDNVGQTWFTPPLTAKDGSPQNANQVDGFFYSALDGSYIYTPSGVSDLTIYRLKPGARIGQPIGVAPFDGETYISGASASPAGALWEMSASGIYVAPLPF